MSSDLIKTIGGHSQRHSTNEKKSYSALEDAFNNSPIGTFQKLQNFPRHVRRQDISRFITKYEIYKKIIEVNGSILECGVFAGGGIFSWLHFSSILEPFNHTRKIIGFDTFEGFSGIDSKDTTTGESNHLKEGAFQTHNSIKEELYSLASIHDSNRPVGHIPKIDLVQGDATQTIPDFIEKNPHTLLSLIYLDFDLYEPTKVALQHLYPRVVTGGIIAFDELNCKDFPGETIALLEYMDIEKVQLKRFSSDPYISYFVKQ